MKEHFLHFVWQFQYFDKSNLFDKEANAVQILSVGEHNTNAGPDFLNAKIKIGEILWHGHVEIHINASDWKAHRHQNDPAYNNVILHVVWNNNEQIVHRDEKYIPTIELKHRVPEEILHQSSQLIDSTENIPCSKLFRKVDAMHVLAMQERCAIERIELKSLAVFELLKRAKGDWSEVAFQMLAKSYGFNINTHPFLKLSQNLPNKVLKKHSGNIFQIEALLFGVGGFLNESPKDEYHSQLMNEYSFLSKKYALEGKEINKAEWKFLRLRPANFPTVRMSQLAVLLNENPTIFDLYTSFENPKEFCKRLQVTPSKYWVEHFDFGKKSKRKQLGMGTDSLENTLINAAVPLLAAFGKHKGEQEYMDRAVDLLQYLRPEKNSIISRWEMLDIKVKDAFESQSLIELYNNYCLKKQCLSCSIGASIISQK